MKPPVTLRDILLYEVRSSWWAHWIGWAPLQSLAGSYFAWKARRKYARWQRSLEEAERVQAGFTAE